MHAIWSRRRTQNAFNSPEWQLKIQFGVDDDECIIYWPTIFETITTKSNAKEKLFAFTGEYFKLIERI